MDRFEELKAKLKEAGGFFKLSKEEQVEYSELNKKNKSVKTGESVEIEKSTKASGDKLEARLEALEKALAAKNAENATLREETQKLQDGWKEYKSPAARKKTATIKIYKENEDEKGGVIVGIRVFKNNAFDEETRKYNKLIYKINVRYGVNDIKELEIDARSFVEIKEVERVDIIKENKRKLKKVQGYAVVPDTDKDGYPKRILSGGSGYGSNVGSDKVPLEVFMVKSTVTVRRANGEEFEIEADNLNI